MTTDAIMQPALLTRAEIEWLLGKKDISKTYERKLRHGINKKLRTFSGLELPLLLERGFSVTIGSNAVTANCNA